MKDDHDLSHLKTDHFWVLRVSGNRSVRSPAAAIFKHPPVSPLCVDLFLQIHDLLGRLESMLDSPVLSESLPNGLLANIRRRVMRIESAT